MVRGFSFAEVAAVGDAFDVDDTKIAGCCAAQNDQLA
jgi:hypothetical protein